MKEREVTERILGCAIAVHRAMGPGLLESIYEECLAREFVARGVAFDRQKPVSLEYRACLGLDFFVVVNGRVPPCLCVSVPPC